MLSSSPGQGIFRGLEASRPRPRTSKCVLEDVLEAKDVLEDSTSDYWIIANKLTLNAKKSNLLVINPKLNSSPTVMNLICSAGSMNSVNKAKYLGIYLDYEPNFLDHINMINIKASPSVGILYKLKCVLITDAQTFTSSFTIRFTNIKFYHSLVHSYFIYGLTEWGNTFPTYFSKLHILQDKAIRIVTGKN